MVSGPAARCRFCGEILPATAPSREIRAHRRSPWSVRGAVSLALLGVAAGVFCLLQPKKASVASPSVAQTPQVVPLPPPAVAERKPSFCELQRQVMSKAADQGLSAETAGQSFVGTQVALEALAGESLPGLCPQCYQVTHHGLAFIVRPAQQVDVLQFSLFMERHQGKPVHLEGIVAGASDWPNLAPLYLRVSAVGPAKGSAEKRNDCAGARQAFVRWCERYGPQPYCRQGSSASNATSAAPSPPPGGASTEATPTESAHSSIDPYRRAREWQGLPPQGKAAAPRVPGTGVGAQPAQDPWEESQTLKSAQPQPQEKSKAAASEDEGQVETVACGSPGWKAFVDPVRTYCSANAKRRESQACWVLPALQSCDASEYDVRPLVYSRDISIGESVMYDVGYAEGKGSSSWQIAFTRRSGGWRVAAITFNAVE
jgi:hypothetical protein